MSWYAFCVAARQLTVSVPVQKGVCRRSQSLFVHAMTAQPCPCGRPDCGDETFDETDAESRCFAGYASCCFVACGGHAEIAPDIVTFESHLRAFVLGRAWRDCELRYLTKLDGCHGKVERGGGWFSVGGIKQKTRRAKYLAAAATLLRRPAFDAPACESHEQYCGAVYEGHERCSRSYGVAYARHYHALFSLE